MTFVPKVLAVGLSSGVQDTIKDLLPTSKIDHINVFKDLMALGAKKAEERNHDIIFIGNECEGAKSPIELIQSTKMIYAKRDENIIYVANTTKSFDRDLYTKNGCKEVFLLPMDHNILKQTLAAIIIKLEHQAYSAVKLLDVAPDTKLPFEVKVYLPTNRKFITYCNVGDNIESKRLETLHKHHVKSIYVPVEQIQNYYDYSASNLQKLYDGDVNLPESARKAKLNTCVRQLIAGMLSESYSQTFQRGKEVANHSKNIVNSFLNLTSKSDAVKKMRAASESEGDAYSHASNVGILASLIAVLLDLKSSVEDLSVAGLLHDLGISELPPNLQEKTSRDISAGEAELYYSHAESSLSIIRARKLAVSTDALTAIEQHHENFSGSGFPKKIESRKLSEGAQVLIIADNIDYLTRVENGNIGLDVDQAIEKIKKEMLVNPQLISKLKSVMS